MILFSEFAVSINVSSTQKERGACLGDVIVFTCTVTGSGSLEWTLEDTSNVRYTVRDEPGSEPGPLPDVINITLINVQSDGALGNFTSNITLVVSQDTVGKHVNCSNGRFTQGSAIMKQCS